jgi:hypothetical protein
VSIIRFTCLRRRKGKEEDVVAPVTRRRKRDPQRFATAKDRYSRYDRKKIVATGTDAEKKIIAADADAEKIDCNQSPAQKKDRSAVVDYERNSTSRITCRWRRWHSDVFGMVRMDTDNAG